MQDLSKYMPPARPDFQQLQGRDHTPLAHRILRRHIVG